MTTITSKTGSLKIIRSNLMHCKLANSTLCHYFDKKNFDFAIIQEPYVSNKRFIKWNRLKGMMFSDITSVAIPYIFCNQDLTTIKVEYLKGNERVTAIITFFSYLPYKEVNPPSSMLQNLIFFCHQSKLELIIGCDSNAHHVIWKISQ